MHPEITGFIFVCAAELQCTVEREPLEKKTSAAVASSFSPLLITHLCIAWDSVCYRKEEKPWHFQKRYWPRVGYQFPNAF